ncbi:MAG: OmpA family protein [Myxococcota bacterium]|nr:OmpA family protein [Myxococcota bacterium]
MTPIVFSLLLGFACKKKPAPAAPVVEAPVVEEPVVKEPEKPSPKIEVVERLAANFQRVYFDLDQSLLNEESKKALDDNITIMQTETALKIEIQGHADERGTTEYNVSLGQQRAERVSQYFTMQGIAPSRIRVVSYGEEEPQASGNHEEAWSKNRRCEFIIVWSENPNIKGSTD